MISLTKLFPILLLISLALAIPTDRTGKLPECATCRKHRDCEQGVCWGKPKKCTDGTYLSAVKCFKSECAPCKSKFECATKKCSKGKCVFKTKASKKKCRSAGGLRAECDKCKKDEDCEQGKCWGKPRKCTDGSFESLSNCFAAECEACSVGFECATKTCKDGKCIDEDNPDNCFKKAECEECKDDGDCEQGKCWGKPKKCTDGSADSLAKCFAPECSDCTVGFECASKTCKDGKCIDEANPDNCFKKAECEECKDDDDCEQGKCWGKPKKCTDGSPDSLSKCFAPECAECTVGFECASKTCKDGKCIDEANPDNCFKNAECEECKEDDDCEQGKCWGKPKKCTDGSADSLAKCFAPECAECTVGFECASKTCKDGKCIDEANPDNCFKNAECEECKEDDDCEQGKCWGKPKKCTDGSADSLSKCFAANCSKCTVGFECASKTCVDGYCVKEGAEDAEECA